MLDYIYKALKLMVDFEEGEIFSKKISLNYDVVSEQPWLYFNCIDKNKYSFKIHELEMKNEGLLWHIAAQEKEKFNFNGHIIFGKLKGYLLTPDKNYKIGIWAKNGRIEKLTSQKEIEEIIGNFVLPINAMNKE